MDEHRQPSEVRWSVRELPEVCGICQEVGPPFVDCTTCGRRKHLVGRSMGEMGSYTCTSYNEPWDCPGYRADPQPSQLWPGERYGESLGHMGWHEERDVQRPARVGDVVERPAWHGGGVVELTEVVGTCDHSEDIARCCGWDLVGLLKEVSDG